MDLLCHLKQKNPQICFWSCGDKEQCQSIEKPLYIIDDCQSLMYLCNYNYATLEYNPKFSRFNEDSKQIEYIEYLRRYRRLHPDFFVKDANGKYVYENNDFNGTKHHITAFRKGKTGCTAINKYKSKLSKSKKFTAFNGITKGDPIICDNTYTDDIAGVKISTGEPFVALEIDETNKKVLIEVVVNGVKKKCWFPIKDENGDNVLLLGFAETIYRFQGQTMEHPMTIHNGEYMTFEAMLTSLSRPRTHNHIFFSNLEELKGVVFESAYAKTGLARIPSQFSEYKSLTKKNRDISFPMTQNEIGDWVLYQEIDENEKQYIGITRLKNNNIEESLKVRHERHLKSKGKRRESPVVSMINPQIEPYKEQPVLIRGTRFQAENIEQSHIRNAYVQLGDQLTNRDIRNLPRVLDHQTLEIIDTNRKQLESYLNRLKIKPPTEKTRKYVVNNKNIATALGYKGKGFKLAKLEEMKTKVETALMKIVFGEEKDKPENVELFERIKEEYQNENKYLTNCNEN